MFVDEAKVQLKAGKGGDGCVSFYRAKFVPKGGPDGGDGGNGGSVILECDENVGDLRVFKFRTLFSAKNGTPGMGRNKKGASGADCVLKVPLGTVVYSAETGQVVTELVTHAERVTLLKGGSGGWGNARFKTSVNQTPRNFHPGKPGEEGGFTFILKTIADIGLVGYPNAGKSSLTNLLTEAHPKTGAYPFTTLNPVVGVIDYPDIYKRLFLADIPGLIDGASQNRGLGHQFLRHIERCRLLVIIVDMAGVDGRDPLDDYKQLLEELSLYDQKLMEKPRLAVGNKMDEEAAEENVKRFKKKYADTLLPISCLSEEGIPELKDSFLVVLDPV